MWECSWRNVPQVKACELCRATQRHRPALDPQQARKQDSLGWWPIDLDTEAERASETRQNSGKDGNGCICRLCAKEQVVCAFDFNEVIFEEQHRVLDHTFQATVLQRCHVNAVAVWWRLKGLESVVDAGPYMASQETISWPAKRQAIFYLGYEVGVEKDEVLQFRMHFSEEKSRIHFEMLEPRLLDRMGLIKFDFDIVNERVLQELQSKLDIKTNRLTAGIQDGSCISQQQLKTGDKLLTFGPFDLLPNTLTEDLWKKVKDRLERHSSRPKRGDQPVRCVFQHGVFEGTRRWPLPTLCDGAVIPRQPSFFEHFGQLAVAPYLTQLETLGLATCACDSSLLARNPCFLVILYKYGISMLVSAGHYFEPFLDKAWHPEFCPLREMSTNLGAEQWSCTVAEYVGEPLRCKSLGFSLKELGNNGRCELSSLVSY